MKYEITIGPPGSPQEDRNLAKQVYLFAFDSVRNSREEIEYAQQRFYQLLVYEGMTVVLTLNQLTDSIAFLCMVRDPACYEKLLELFEIGAVKVSRFGQSPSAASYVKTRLQKCLDQGKASAEGGTQEAPAKDTSKKSGGFIFSALPIRTTGDQYDHELLQAMKKSLDASDPSYLRELLESRAGGKQLDDSAQFLLRYIKLLLRMSMAELAANPAKGGTWPKQKDYIKQLFSMTDSESIHYCRLANLTLAQWNPVQHLLKQLFEQIAQEGKDPDSRSDWHMLLKERLESHPEERETLICAEGVIDFCYNISSENSITNISTHYEPGDGTQQLEQMFTQLGLYLDPQQNHNHQFLQGDEAEIEWPEEVQLADLKKAVRILKTTNAKERHYAGISVSQEKERYKRAWGRQILSSLGKHIVQILLSMAVFLASEAIINWAQEILPVNNIISSLIQLLLFCLFETFLLQFLELCLGVDDLDALYLLIALKEQISDSWTLFVSRNLYFSKKERGDFLL